MIFQHTFEDVLSGKKTQTRRPVRPGDRFFANESNQIQRVGRVSENRVTCRFAVGQDYAVQPGRGQSAVARIRVTDIRRAERAGDISEEDAQAEGFEWYDTYTPIRGEEHLLEPDREVSPVEQFQSLYASMHGKRALEEPCWVVQFELVKEGADA